MNAMDFDTFAQSPAGSFQEAQNIYDDFEHHRIPSDDESNSRALGAGLVDIEEPLSSDDEPTGTPPGSEDGSQSEDDSDGDLRAAQTPHAIRRVEVAYQPGPMPHHPPPPPAELDQFTYWTLRHYGSILRTGGTTKAYNEHKQNLNDFAHAGVGSLYTAQKLLEDLSGLQPIYVRSCHLSIL